MSNSPPMINRAFLLDTLNIVAPEFAQTLGGYINQKPLLTIDEINVNIQQAYQEHQLDQTQQPPENYREWYSDMVHRVIPSFKPKRVLEGC